MYYLYAHPKCLRRSYRICIIIIVKYINCITNVLLSYLISRRHFVVVVRCDKVEWKNYKKRTLSR